MTWLDELPTEPGAYWFYGWLFGDDLKGRPPSFKIVYVKPIANGVMATCEGHFWFDCQPAVGKFFPVSHPEPPTVEPSAPLDRNPGADAARYKGCTCNPLDNRFGRCGPFSVRADCPFHGENGTHRV